GARPSEGEADEGRPGAEVLQPGDRLREAAARARGQRQRRWPCRRPRSSRPHRPGGGRHGRRPVRRLGAPLRL
ncbi:MAG: hypothetical protein AVDCRST_MAG35-559, partial [uncultured Quadrisphaera sp.]